MRIACYILNISLTILFFPLVYVNLSYNYFKKEREIFSQCPLSNYLLEMSGARISRGKQALC